MISLFLGLSAVNLLGLAIALVLGYLVRRDPLYWGTWHQLAGVLSAITCVAVHCTVFTYFIATAKWVLHAVSVKHLDPKLAAPTRSFKAQAFPAALLAMTMVFLTAVSGAATFSGYLQTPWFHHALAWTAIIVNLLVAFVEFRAIRRNGALIDEILWKIAEEVEPRRHEVTKS